MLHGSPQSPAGHHCHFLTASPDSFQHYSLPGQMQLRHMFPLIRVPLLTCTTVLKHEFYFLPASWSSVLSCGFSCGPKIENQSSGILKYRGAGGWLPVNEALMSLHAISFPFCHLQLTAFDLKFEFGPKCQWNISKIGFG